jgi:hypothetical protein
MDVVFNEFDLANPLPLLSIRRDVHPCAATRDVRTSQRKVARAEDNNALGTDVVESDVVPSHDDRAVHTYISDDAASPGDGECGCHCCILKLALRFD